MSLSYNITTSILALSTGGMIIYLARRNLLHISYALWWICAAVIIILSGLFPFIFDTIGHALGVSYPPILFLTIALLAIALRLLMADIERTRNTVTIRRMAQQQAALALRLRTLEKRLNADAMCAQSAQKFTQEQVNGQED